MGELKQMDVWDLQFAGAGEVLPTVEVDTGDEHAVACACERAIESVLSAAKKSKCVTVYVYEGPSINFGRPTNSIFFAVAGPERLLIRVHAALAAVSGAKVRFGDCLSASSCIPNFHLQDGKLWRPIESDTWEAVR